MQILFSRVDIRNGLAEFRSGLRELCGESTLATWAFPGGGKDELPTWMVEDVNGSPLSIGVGATGSWETRTPVLVARTSLARTITPCVEINIPNGGAVNRNVAGCLCRTRDQSLLIAHRGTGLTTSGRRVTKEQMHARFAKWLLDAKDDGRTSPIIPAAPLDTTLVDHIARFADEIVALKAAQSNDSAIADAPWRENLQFPDVVSGFNGKNVEAREYQHGPIQAALQEMLRPNLNSELRVVFNQSIDLAIVDQAHAVTAIFEVKTELGSQVYSGVGQLLIYRERFGSVATRLFLVLPKSAFDGKTTELGTMLKGIGIDVIVFAKGRFSRWDGQSLGSVLGPDVMSTR